MAAESATPRELSPELWLPFSEGIPERKDSAQNRGELARQVAYAGIDIALVCVGSATAFLLRFGLSNAFSHAAPPSVSLLGQAWSVGYPGFLLLYAGLVVLACMSQDLYRTARE